MSVPPLWDFSLAVYGRDGVKEACLSFQDAGGDVNVGLFVCWTALQGRDPNPVLAPLLETSSQWRSSVVEHLRSARNALKPGPEYVPEETALALRKAILSAELQAERVQQGFLEPLREDTPLLDESEEVSATASRALTGSGPGVSEAVSARFVETIFEAWKTV